MIKILMLKSLSAKFTIDTVKFPMPILYYIKIILKYNILLTIYASIKIENI